MPSISTDPARWLARCRENARALGHRRLLIIEGESEAAGTRAAQLWQAADDERCLWVGTGAPDPDRQTDGTRARLWLGQELDLLVWNIHDGLHPDGFAALSGTVVAGGLLVVVAPALGRWGEFADPDYDRAGLHHLPYHHFLARLSRCFATAPQVLRMTADADWPAIAAAQAGAAWQRPEPGLPTPEQAGLIDAVRRVVTGHRRRPLVISADRGRGKSAALGMAAAALIAEGRERILVTAPHRESAETLFRHAREAGLDEGPALGFVPPDVLLREAPPCDLLIVDEAAAIPPALLSRMLARYARIVFATTLHGYEGTGRGFLLRFAATLDREAPRWRRMTPRHPVRWAPDDPLEALINEAFLLDAEAGQPPRTADIEYLPWPGELRAADEERLRQAYGLLVEAHYRTTPGDLRPLLDDPDLHCWLALADGVVVGVVTVMAEGALDPALGEVVFRGERRLRGHLLAQSLANHGGDPEAPSRRYGRIVRIAVHPDRRRQGIARRLVELAGAAGQTKDWDVLGTSFSLEPGILAFWRHCGLEVLRLGLQHQTSTGAHSIMLGRGLTDAGRDLVTRHGRRFAQYWPQLLTTVFATLGPELVWQLSADLPPPAGIDVDDRREIRGFVDGYRLLDLSLWPLRKLTLWALTRPGAVDGPGAEPWTPDDITLWVAVVLQQQGWEPLREAGLIRGRRDGEQRLRILAGRLLSAAGDSR